MNRLSLSLAAILAASSLVYSQDSIATMRQKRNVAVLKNLKSMNLTILALKPEEPLRQSLGAELKKMLSETGLSVTFYESATDLGAYKPGASTLQLNLMPTDATNREAGFSIGGFLQENLILERNGKDIPAESWRFFDKYSPTTETLHADSIFSAKERLQGVVRQFIEDYKQANPN